MEARNTDRDKDDRNRGNKSIDDTIGKREENWEATTLQENDST